jgi:NAD(P)-dependent dehydrogenase (short-subunit alcohol dehydrogenase family)
VKRLAGRIAIVTGAGQGIGRAIALAMAREGASVVVADINVATAQRVQAEAAQAGGNSLGIATDVASEESVNFLVRRCVGELGGVDILVNNAGIFPRCSVAGMSEELWDRVVGINLTGAFLCGRAVVPEFLRRGRGRIVNISSGLAFQGARFGAHYAASKAGLIGLTKALALELAPYGITANAISPGMTDTALPHSGGSADELLIRAQQIPLGRVAQPEDITGAAVFLASDAAQFITGQVLLVNGGTLMY